MQNELVTIAHTCVVDCNVLELVTLIQTGRRSNMAFLKYQYWGLFYSTYSLMILLILLTMHAKLRLYADETTLYLSRSNQEALKSRAQSKFDVLQSWFKCNY